MASDAPPPYVRTVYDETLRSKFYPLPSIDSIANACNLLGHLEHHSPSTDGSFSICVANGRGVFISKALYESVPAEHRPPLNTDYTPGVQTLACGVMPSIGTTLFPFLLTNRDTGEEMRIVLHVIVVPNLFINMFIGTSGGELVSYTQYSRDGPVFGFNFGRGEDDLTFVRGTMPRSIF
ncbi:hypothetical protein CVT26_015614 [Gymnopilus dilepis]|uniref:Uncharacterized protein n=1 Tax=Gymnopilus dilepis TaxID=231916 RepID=A0A409YDC5_9AGAR|nr:hypothetical protein CVT26_015614 [Gymnopilus dilepis]